MTFKWWSQHGSITPIGLDIDGRSIAAAQLRQKVEGWEIVAATALPRLTQQPLPDAAEIDRLSQVLRRQGFVSNKIVVAAPKHTLLTGVLDLPPANSNAPFDQIARMELARMHKCEPDSFELAYWELPARQRSAGSSNAEVERRQASAPRNVMAAACSTVDAAPLLDAFENQGWDVRAMDIQCWAMLRACAGARPFNGKSGGESAPAALLSLGWNAASLVLRHQSVVVYQRTLDDAGLQPIHQSIMTHAHVNAELADMVLFKTGLSTPDSRAASSAPADGSVILARGSAGLSSRALSEARRFISGHLDAIVSEVRTSGSYMAHRYTDATPKCLLLMGEGAAIPGAAEYLARELGMEVAVVSAADIAPCSPTLMPVCAGPGGAALMTAMGLAMWGADKTPGTRENASAHQRLNPENASESWKEAA